MDVVMDLPADPKAAASVQVGEGALHNPALIAESGAVFGAASSDEWLHGERADEAAVLVVVVAAVPGTTSGRRLRRFFGIFRPKRADGDGLDDHQVVNTEYWTVLGDSERDQWTYVPRQTIGPLRFGMDREEAITVMAAYGFTAEQSDMGSWHLTGRTQWRVEFLKPRPVAWSRPGGVKCYFIEGAGLTCVLVDGLLGPQVTHEGIRLIGRVPSELYQDMEAYARQHDLGLQSSPGGDLFVEGFEIELGAQRAGDTALTWALFFNTGTIAGTSWDIAPAEVWRQW